MKKNIRVTLAWLLIFTILASSSAQAAGNASPQAATGPSLSVNAAQNRKDISPYIYGLNFAKQSFADEIDLPVRRWGGNATSRYNWQNGYTNTAMDWYYENITAYNPYTGAGENHNAWIAQNLATQTDSIITIPMIGYVAKDATSCGFHKTTYPNQQDFDPYNENCGNGKNTNGTPITGNDPLDTSIAVTENDMKSWAADMVTQYGDANSGGVKFYNLDNEPELWSDTHRVVHPAHQTYTELVDKSISYAAAIKEADPNALTLGYASFGWTGYWYSWSDAQNAEEHNYNCVPAASCFTEYETTGKYQVEYYLDEMRKYDETDNNPRLLDYLDLHYYQAGGMALTTAGNDTLQAKRLKSTQALWNPNYPDDSWIGGNDQDADKRAVQLIPRMRGWVNTYYPGTKLAITEYNWGGLEHINGALTQADVLGIFGREGLDLATLWNYPLLYNDWLGYDHFETLPGAYAFRIYRNYDGAGNKFGDVSIKAVSGDQGRLSIYAAERTKDGALTLMIINKTSGALTSAVSLSNFKPASIAKVYRYSPSNLNAIIRQADQAVKTSGFSASFPANSITLVVIPKQIAKNGGFNTYSGTSKIPANWKAANFSATDGKYTTLKKEGTASVLIKGAPGKTKTLMQTVLINGNSGDKLNFGFWVKGSAVPTNGICRAQVQLYNGSTQIANKVVSCPAGTYEFTKKSLTVTAPNVYTKIVVKFTYAKAGGMIWLDAASLTR